MSFLTALCNGLIGPSSSSLNLLGLNIPYFWNYICLVFSFIDANCTFPIYVLIYSSYNPTHPSVHVHIDHVYFSFLFFR